MFYIFMNCFLVNQCLHITVFFRLPLEIFLEKMKSKFFLNSLRQIIYILLFALNLCFKFGSRIKTLHVNMDLHVDLDNVTIFIVEW